MEGKEREREEGRKEGKKEGRKGGKGKERGFWNTIKPQYTHVE